MNMVELNMIVRQIQSRAHRRAKVEGHVDILVDDEDLWARSQSGPR